MPARWIDVSWHAADWRPPSLVRIYGAAFLAVTPFSAWHHARPQSKRLPLKRSRPRASDFST
jgi:hypothetical protein